MGRWHVGAGSGVRESLQTSPSHQANDIPICDGDSAILVPVNKIIPALKGRAFTKPGVHNVCAVPKLPTKPRNGIAGVN